MSYILLAEDNDQIRSFLTEMLEIHHHIVDPVCNGLLAIQKMEQNSYDLILTDIIMPENDGSEVIKKVAKRTKAIAMSGDTLLFKKAIEAGANATMLKTNNVPEMIAIIEAILNAN